MTMTPSSESSSSDSTTDEVPPPSPSLLPISMRFMRNFAFCRACDDKKSEDPLKSLEERMKLEDSTIMSSTLNCINANATTNSIESLIREYAAACNLYGCSDRINAGVLTTLRFSLPFLRCSGSFHDSDMLALCELMLNHCNGALKFIKRLDFSRSSKEGKLNGKSGFTSHGAYALSRVLEKSQFIQEVFVQRNRIGPFGATAIFKAASVNASLQIIVVRRCLIGEKGAIAFAEHLCNSKITRVKEVDISVNHIGISGSIAIETALVERYKRGLGIIDVDLEGNLIFQEIMNSITHGLGVILSIIGSILLSNRVKNSSRTHIVCCAIYSCSLLTLYLSSTLFHSFFALTTTRYLFGVFDHCAIYILIAGSYTPFLGITLVDKPLWSVYLLSLIWICCFAGISVEAFYPNWKYKSSFSLAMYLGMGWMCMVCVPDLLEKLPQGAINLIVLGGVGYTSGVPFFVRNNNLDHSIWHLFVLAASIFHWFGVFSFIAPLP